MRRLLWPLLLALPLAGLLPLHPQHRGGRAHPTRHPGSPRETGHPDRGLAPGATYLFPIFLTDWHTFDVSLQNLSMVRDVKKRPSKEDDLFFKTIDGTTSGWTSPWPGPSTPSARRTS
jgi:hypothetical protein